MKLTKLKEKIESINKKIDEFSDQINLAKLYPDYFIKNIFRIGLGLCFVFFLIAFISNGCELNLHYIECKEPVCENPLYICPECDGFEDCMKINSDYCSQKELIPVEYEKYIEKFGSRKKLNRGEIIGNKPNFFGLYLLQICCFIMTFAFIVNHVLYLRRKKHE